MKNQDTWVEIFATHIANEIFRHLESEEKVQGSEFRTKVVAAVVARIMGFEVYHSLSQAAKSSSVKQERIENTMKRLSEVKSQMQDAAAAAFQGAMTKWSGQTAEYYCQIKLVPEPLNKEPC